MPQRQCLAPMGISPPEIRVEALTVRQKPSRFIYERLVDIRPSFMSAARPVMRGPPIAF
jgi:hypothetical protein